MTDSESVSEYCPNCLSTLVEGKAALTLCFACGADWPAGEPERYDAVDATGGESA
jgi:hypothetical protein